MNNQSLKKIWLKVPHDYYEKGNRTNILQKFWHEKKWQILKGFAGKKYQTILDVGCASGHISYLFKKLFPESSVTGIDPASHFIKFAKKTYPTVNFQCVDAHKLPFKDKSFDLIICTEMLEHVLNPGIVLSEIRRCLKKNGEVFISMDSGNLLFKIVWFFWTKFGPGKIWQGAHLQEFNTRKLENLIRSSKFYIKEKKITHFSMAVFFKVQAKKVNILRK